MFSYVTAQSTFYHQGYDLFEDNESFMKDVTSKVRPLTYIYIYIM